MSCRSHGRRCLTGKSLASCAAALTLLSTANLAQADGSVANRVEVTLVGQVAELKELRGLLQDWSAAIAVEQTNRLSINDVLGGPLVHGHLRIWVVLTQPSLARIYFADASGERYYVREVPLSSGLDEAGREVLSQIIVTSAQAFVEKAVDSSASEVASSLRESSAETTTEPSVRGELPLPSMAKRQDLKAGPLTPSDDNRREGQTVALGEWWPRVGVVYSAAALGPDVIAHGPGVLAGVAHFSDLAHWWVVGKAQYRFPLFIGINDSTLALRASFWELAWGVESYVAPGRYVGFEVTAGVERVEFSLDASADPTIRPRPNSVRYRPSVGADLRAGFELGSIRATALLGVRAAFFLTHYDVSESRIFTPWAISPRTAFEVSWR